MDPNVIHFEDPPLVEVSIGIQFVDLPLRTVHIGDFRKRFAEQLSLENYEEQQPLEPRIEVFEPIQRRFPEIRVETLPPLARQWFSSKDGTRLVQLQRDRFIYNWRRATADSYDRYPLVKSRFEESYMAFLEVLKGILPESPDPISITQCELAYFNHIEPGAVWSTHADLDKVISTIKHPGFLQSGLEDERYGFRKLLATAAERPAGRVYVNVTPAFRASDSKPLITIDITARGRPDDDGIGSALTFFDICHSEINQLFIALTTEQMHDVWRRIK